MNQASFTIRKSVLEKALIKKSKLIGLASKYNNNTTIELTITDGLLTLVVPGSRVELKCETVSTAKATIGFFYFKNIIQSWNNLKVECIITTKTIKIGATSYHAQSTFFESDRILRSIKLPMNYTAHHLLQLENKGFTEEEIAFNDLEFAVYQAKKELKANIRKTVSYLKQYGVTTEEIEALINSKIK